MDFNYLEVQAHPSGQIEALLKSNVIGTPGISMLYQHLGVDQKLHRIQKPHFVSVRRRDTVVGTCCFCERELESITAFYVRYFAFSNSFRIKEAPRSHLQPKQSILRSEIIELLNGKGLLSDTDKPFFHYAYVDPRNPRSARLCEEFRFVPIRKYTTRLFSRLWPAQHPDLNVKELPAASERIRALLSSFYKDYHHFSFENLDKTYHYVEDEQGEIVAGVQVNPDAWRVITLPGKQGRILLTLFDRMPLISRLLSKKFRFLAVEGIYYQTGKEPIFEKLLEALLHRHSVNTAVMVVDVSSSLHELTQQINLGPLAKISPKVYGNVIARYRNVDESFIDQQKARPSYISVHDLS